MRRQTARQILAFTILGGFVGLTAALVLFEGLSQRVDLIWGAWVGLVTMVMRDYFSQEKDEPDAVDSAAHAGMPAQSVSSLRRE